MTLKFRPLRADEIECRVGSAYDWGLRLLLYKDARADMDLLDETVGPMGWTRHHSRDNANCTVSIYDTDLGYWVSKEDTGTESNTEAQKGLASDSFKRACTNWGIGRELYTAPDIVVKKGSYSVNKAGKCNDRFKVTHIGYDEARNISELEIINKSGKVVFRVANDVKKEPEPAPKEQAEPIYCDTCGRPILDYAWASGRTTSAGKLAKLTKEKTGMCLCGDCYTQYRAEHGN